MKKYAKSNSLITMSIKCEINVKTVCKGISAIDQLQKLPARSTFIQKKFISLFRKKNS